MPQIALFHFMTKNDHSCEKNYQQNTCSRRTIIVAANEKLFWTACNIWQNRAAGVHTLTRPRQFKLHCNENCQLHIAIYVLVNRGERRRERKKDRKKNRRKKKVERAVRLHYFLSDNEKRWCISIASIDQRGILHERFLDTD